MSSVSESGQRGPAGERLRELVVEVLERVDRAGFGELDLACAENSDLAEALRERIDGLRELGLLGVPAGRHPERVGDFRLLEEIGSGGMGVVYRAVQESLGREVALKLIRPDVLFQDDARDRFARETTVIARLQHPGIVPIYTVGDEGELPWYAMEHVPGCTLAEALEEIGPRSSEGLLGRDLLAAICKRSGRELPDVLSPLYDGSWETTALRIVRNVADALEHAHGRGVLHRDLKPSNIMVTPEGRVMLVDFGLSQSEGDDSLTGTGDRLGSLPYMPPELLRDGPRVLDQRSDVYCLGVVLYELLTLHRPFSQEGLPGKMAAILEGRPPRLRAYSHELSWEAETVCLAAMESDSRRRYASSADFARDLENALEHRPLEARRASRLLLIRRVVQRHPAAALALLLVLLLPTVVAFMQARETASVGIALESAERNRDRALRAIDEMLMEVASERLDHVPRVHELRKDVYERARVLYDELARETPGDVSIRLLAAEADLQLTWLRTRAGRPEESEDSLRGILRGLDPFLADADFRVRRSYAYAMLYLSQAVRMRHDEEEAHSLLETALAQLSVLTEEFPDHVGVAAARLEALAADVLYDRQRGVLAHGGERLRAIEVDARALQDSHPTEGLPVLAKVLYKRGVWSHREFDLESARELWEEALTAFRELLAESPQDESFRFQASQTAGRLGVAYAESGRRTEAGETFAFAARLAEAVARDYPEVPAYREHVARLANQRGVLAGELGDHETALGYYEHAVANYNEVLDGGKLSVSVHRGLGSTYLNLSSVHLIRREVERGVWACDQALEQFQAAVATEPDDPECREWLAVERIQRCHVLMRSYRFVEGARALAEAPDYVALRLSRLTEITGKMIDVLETVPLADDADVLDGCREAARALERKLSSRPIPDEALLDRLRGLLDQ